MNLTKKFNDCVKPEDVPIGTAPSVLSDSAFLGVGKLKSTSKDLYILYKGTWFQDVHVARITERLSEAMCKLGY